MLAHLDDFFLVGPAKHVLDAFSTLQPKFFKIGLEIQETKCEIYCSYDKEDTFPSEYTTPVSCEGIEILGTPIGKREYVARACSTITKKGMIFVDSLSTWIMCKHPRCFLDTVIPHD